MLALSNCQGTGPWNLEVQVVGPKSSENILIPNIESSRKKLGIRIPEKIDKEGGAFEIDLGKAPYRHIYIYIYPVRLTCHTSEC